VRRWWLLILLLLSVGINIGLILAFASGKLSQQAQLRQPSALEQELSRIEGRIGPFVMRMADELGLQAEKRRLFARHQRRFFQQTLAARRRFREVQKQLVHEIAAADPDRQSIDRFLDQLVAAYAAQERAFVDNMVATRELLDDQQRQKFSRFLVRVRQLAQGGGRSSDRRARQRFQELQRQRGQRRGPPAPPPG